MGLNIKNKEVVANVRRLAEMEGVSMTKAVDDAVKGALLVAENREQAHAELRRRQLDRILADIRSRIRPLRDGEVASDMSDLYDDWGLPR